ncbi:Mariner Mos1 transposase, partial [Stegodyphus mimosarum]
MLEQLGSEPDFLDNIIAGDKSWIFQYDPETKHQNLEWHTLNSTCPKKARMSNDKRGVVHKEFVPLEQIVNDIFYEEIIVDLYRVIKRKRLEIAFHWKLHHDNAPAHTAFIVTAI